MIILDGGRNMLTGKEAEKVPEVQKTTAKSNK